MTQGLGRGVTIAGIAMLCLLLTAAPAQSAAISPLSGSPSPYLTRHAEDPVQWRAWGPAALEEARRTGKLIFVSSGYFSCYWCHRMRQENFLDATVAGYLNEHYIPVLIDRELEPGLDAYLVGFIRRMQGYSGWPLQVFLTPEGYPLAGTLYAPRDEFLDMLRELAGEWRADAPRLAALAREAQLSAPSSARLAPLPIETGSGERFESALLSQALTIADFEAGGFGTQNKFPFTPQLQALLDLQRRVPQARLREFLQLTLDRMASGGLRDHIGGGFFRYTVDAQWREPHFEKMLSDNAQLALLYLDAAQLFQRDDYRQIGRETLDFMLRELGLENGAFAASLAAVDESGIEGAYYLWSEAELAALLGEEQRALLRSAWGGERAVRLEGGYLPLPAVPAAQLGRPADEVERQLHEATETLRRARQGRPLPRDDKPLAGWNGLALAALAHGAQLPDGARYRAAGERLRVYLVETLWDGAELHRVAAAPGTLEDYAYVAYGLRAWSRAVDSAPDRRLATQLIEGAWQRFYGRDNGWLRAQQSLLPAPMNEAALPDGPLPSPSGILLALSLGGAEPADAGALRERSMAALRLARPHIEANPFAHASCIEALAQQERQ